MRKYYISFIIATIAIISLQGLFVHNLYKSYLVSESEYIESTIRQTLDAKNFDKLFGVTLEVKSNQTIDDYYESGMMVDANLLDSLFYITLKREYSSIVELHNSRYIMQNLKRRYTEKDYNFISADIPIGLKGYQFIKVYAAIPISHFIVNSIWLLALSVAMILLVILLLFYLISTIRAKQEQLSVRENNLYGMMHDLKSPLSGVAMTLDFAKQKVNDPQIKAIFSLNESKISHLIAGINTMLTAGRGGARIKREIITADELSSSINIIIYDLKNIYAHKEHTIDTTIDKIDINADKIYLENLLRNLLENSIKYSDSGVEISLSVEKSDNSAQFTVSDNGWGIASKYHKKVFRNFYQIPHGRANERGYGVGLAQVKQIIKEHRGTLKLQSKENKGTKIIFTIPQ